MQRVNQVNEVTYSSKPDTRAVCPKCGCHWFKQIEAQQIDKEHYISVGQKINPIDNIRFVLLQCVKCSELLEPNFTYVSTDKIGEAYNNLLNEVEAPLETD